MCGRYRIKDTDAVDALTRRLFGIPAWAVGPVAPRYNVAPGQDIGGLTTRAPGEFVARSFRWGLLPAWAAAARFRVRPINAQAETVAEKPMFRQAFARRRCLLPADGFYEWQRIEGGPKQAFDIHLRGGRPFFLAGIYEEGEAGQLLTCAIITTRPNGPMARVHDRMPAVLEGDSARRWLQPGTIPADEWIRLSAPPPDGEMELVPVSARVNSPACDGPECLAPVEPREPGRSEATGGQGLLF